MQAWFRIPKTIVAVLALLVTSTFVALAYEVEPMRIVLDIGSGRTSSILNVRNTRDRDLPIEIVMKRRVVHPDGSQEFVPADEDFSIFPPLALIEPGNSQAVRITYIGDPTIEDSQAFVAEVQEVPVSQDGFTGVVFAYNFGVAVYVRADQAQASVSVGEVRRTETGIEFDVTNGGSDFAMLGDLGVRIQAGDQIVNLTAAQVAEVIENPIIPPHASRVFQLGIHDLPDGPVGITLARSF